MRLEATYEGGRCSIQAQIEVDVKHGDLQLSISETNTLLVTWNGGSPPEGTVFFVRSIEDPDSPEGDWAKTEQKPTELTSPGHYQYKAVFAGTESNIVDLIVDPPTPDIDEGELPDGDDTEIPTDTTGGDDIEPLQEAK